MFLPETSVLDAIKLMAEKNIGSVVVMENDNFLGIVTERDYSRKVILKGKHSSDTKVSEIMSEDLPSLRPDDSVELCMSLMTQQNIRYLPVFENDRLCGIISMSDVVRETILHKKKPSITWKIISGVDTINFRQHSLKLIGIFTARPPSAVSLYLLFISCAVSHMVLITASSETLAKSGVLCNAS